MEARDMAIRAHYDGKTIVPDEPLDLPINQPLEVDFRIVEDRLSDEEIRRRRAALRRFAAHAIKGVDIPLEATRRENMYEPPRGL
jgi:hypothetical protein